MSNPEVNVTPESVRSGLTADGDPIVFVDPAASHAMSAGDASALGAAFTDAARRSEMMSEVKKWLVGLGCPEDLARKAALDLEQRDNKDRLMKALMPVAGLFGQL